MFCTCIAKQTRFVLLVLYLVQEWAESLGSVPLMESYKAQRESTIIRTVMHLGFDVDGITSRTAAAATSASDCEMELQETTQQRNVKHAIRVVLKMPVLRLSIPDPLRCGAARHHNATQRKQSVHCGCLLNTESICVSSSVRYFQRKLSSWSSRQP